MRRAYEIKQVNINTLKEWRPSKLAKYLERLVGAYEWDHRHYSFWYVANKESPLYKVSGDLTQLLKLRHMKVFDRIYYPDKESEVIEVKDKNYYFYRGYCGMNKENKDMIIDAIKEIYDSIDSESSRKQYNKKLIEQASIEWVFHPD
tara:strand:- start:6291 stop:6731 length:441 start_codon:yes stop_codon:yes gene_type:complete